MSTADNDTALFTGLVSMFHAAALQQLGKVLNPATANIERNLEQAQLSIDMLEMLARKMKGNLTDDEHRLLSSATRDLKIQYVEEVGKDQSQAKGGA